MTDTDNTLPRVAQATPHVAQAADPPVARMFGIAKKCIVIFGVTGAIVLVTLGAVAVAHGTPSVFMWVRTAILLAMTPLLYLFALRAARGGRYAFQRLRLLSTALPVAIIVVDLIPGVCPVWYAAMQGASGLALVPIAILTRRLELREAFSREP